MITQAGLRPSAASFSIRRSIAPASLNGTGIVSSVDGGRDAGAVGQRGLVLAIADLVVLDADRDHHAVVVAVVGAEDLHDRVAAGVGARDPDRVHRRLRAGVGVAPAREVPAALQLLGHDDRVLRRGGEVRAGAVAIVDGLADRRMGMALDHRSEAIVEVPHLVAVDVPHLRPDAPLEVDRPGVAQLVGGRDAGAEHPVGAAEHLRRSAGAVVELLLLALGEVLDALAVQRDGGRDGHVISPRSLRPSRVEAALAAGRSVHVADVRHPG